MAMIAVPMQQRALAFAIGFRDRFLPQPDDPPLRVPLLVEALGQRAFAGPDWTYRISVVGTPPNVPTGTFPISVWAPGGEYLAFDPIEVTLPLPAATPPRRGDYLRLHVLWPTRLLTLPAGETALVGTITQQGVPRAGLKVLLHKGTSPASDTPDARSDVTGTFLYRLPFAPGTSQPQPLLCNLTVLEGSTPVPAMPASVALVPGTTNRFMFNLT